MMGFRFQDPLWLLMLIPLALLWWSRSSRGSIPDTIARTAKNQLAQLRRRLHQQSPQWWIQESTQ